MLAESDEDVDRLVADHEPRLQRGMATAKKKKTAKKQAHPCNHFSITLTDEDIKTEDFKSWLEDYATDYYFQVERGKVEEKRHFQALVYIKKKTRATAVARHLRACAEGKIQLDVSPVGDGRVKAMKRYTTKCDTRIEGPFSNKPIYMGADLVCVEATPTPMQKQVLDILATKPDDRTINYFWDEKGNIGKSKLCKYLAFYKKAKVIKVTTAERLASAICKAGAFGAYAVDIPRTVDTEKSITGVFEVLEGLKNGHVIDNMYGSDNELFMDSPHVFVFANYPPDKSRMSQDRWNVINLNIEIGPLFGEEMNVVDGEPEELDDNGNLLNLVVPSDEEEEIDWG